MILTYSGTFCAEINLHSNALVANQHFYSKLCLFVVIASYGLHSLNELPDSSFLSVLLCLLLVLGFGLQFSLV